VAAIHVSVDNFVRAETDRMFDALGRAAGGINRWQHRRGPASVDQQPVIRSNRDTLYSTALVDVSARATLTLPDAGERYQSVMVLNEDHYINRIFHDRGQYELSVEEFDTQFVLLAVRILVDPNDPADLGAVAALQDKLGLEASAASPFVLPDYDVPSLDSTRRALLDLSRGLTEFSRAFGSREDVDPVRHLIATAAGWGGLPEREASYASVEPKLPVGEYSLNVHDVPVDGFWSISVYNADGFFEANDRAAYSVNNITATPDDDGSVTVHFGGCDDDRPNCIPIMDGWNYAVRMYRPRAEILDRSWTFPAIASPGV
jgi:hypothetical protein